MDREKVISEFLQKMMILLDTVPAEVGAAVLIYSLAIWAIDLDMGKEKFMMEMSKAYDHYKEQQP